MKRKRTELTIEMDEIWVIRRSGGVALAWCPGCREQTTMITPDELAVLTRLDVPAIYRLMESGSIHCTQTPGGFLLVCSNSIARLATDQADPRAKCS